ncbi:hypothetical protein K491DRAFT_761668 [Lophiostoma macrostomum CBS 122681]|uniref:Uncharacterized protein n=1 Tax=Lophiostoma macrostomum CBS 122681 TaxID=1314788 RepID=A0A6A6SS86_9PLEO|nr:hypothetical protein K491DRAFT_761668 [Lophiostoma macrostomum CBS 122681]
MRSSLFVSGLGLLVLGAAGAPIDPVPANKKVLDPPIPDLSQYLLRDLNSYQGVVKAWDEGKTFEVCKTWFDKLGLKVQDSETSDLVYSDCDEPWSVCRHKDAEWVGDVVKEYFGRVPTRMRSNIRHLVNLPAMNGNSSVIHDRNLNTLVVIGKPSFHEFLAGAAKPLAFNNRGYKAVGPFYNSQYWKDAVAKDTNVANEESEYSDECNLAQETVITLFDVRDTAGIKWLAPNADGIKNQMASIKAHILPDTLNPSEKFNSRPSTLPSSLSSSFFSLPSFFPFPRSTPSPVLPLLPFYPDIDYMALFNTTQLKERLLKMPSSNICWPLVCGAIVCYAVADTSHLPDLDDIYRLIFTLLYVAIWVYFLLEYHNYKSLSPNTPPSTSSNLRALAAAASANELKTAPPTPGTPETDNPTWAIESSRILPGLFDSTDFTTWYPSHLPPTNGLIFGQATYQHISAYLSTLHTRYIKPHPRTLSRHRRAPRSLREDLTAIFHPLQPYYNTATRAYQWLTRPVPGPMLTRRIPCLYPSDALAFPSVEWSESGMWPDPGRMYMDFDIIDEVLYGGRWVLDRVVWNEWTPWGWVAGKVYRGEAGFWWWERRREVLRQVRESWEEDFLAGY